MKEFKNYIEIGPLSEIVSIDGTTITMRSDQVMDRIFTSSDVLPEEKDQPGGGSRYYSQSLTVVCDKLSDTLYNRYRDRKVIVKLVDDGGNELLLGSLEYPSRSAVAPKLYQDQIKITCDSPDSIYS